MTNQNTKPKQTKAKQPSNIPEGIELNDMWITIAVTKHPDYGITIITDVTKAGDKGMILRDTAIIPGQTPTVTTTFIQNVTFKETTIKRDNKTKSFISLEGGSRSGGSWRTGGGFNKKGGSK